MSKIVTNSIYFKGLLLLIAMILVLATIDAVSNSLRDKQSSSDDVEAQALKQEWSEAVEALKSYSANQRDQAVSRAEQTLTAMDKRIEQLQSRAERDWQSLSKNVRERRRDTLRGLRQERNQLAEWYGGMKHSSDDAWEEVKQGFINAYGALSTSFSNASSEFNNYHNDKNDGENDGDRKSGDKKSRDKK